MSPKTRRRPVVERFWSKVAGGDFTTCWEWTGATNSKTGYGSFCIEAGKYVLPHRFAYATLRAEIPAGLQIDHLCRNTLCVNPWHLEPVTPRENVHRSFNPAGQNARRTQCVNGHELTEDNVYRSRGDMTKRKCATCHKERARKAWASKKAQTASALAATQTGGAR